MKISGFSFVRNAASLYYPVVEAIHSILPMVDEFVIAVGKGDAGDSTRDDIGAINDPKLRIIDTVWEEQYYKRGIINAMQTDIAQQACTGDWLMYVQADEVVHEKYHQVIVDRCRELLDNKNVEGLLFGYKHFWGDYGHYQDGHGWYPHEIRLVRNVPTIHSFESAQSFRHFDPYTHPRQPKGTRKLKVARVNAEIYHYGWVRPPHLMQSKRKALDTVHMGKERAQEHYAQAPKTFDYGPLDKLAVFKDTHPQVMRERIANMDWAGDLQYTGRRRKDRALNKHERLRYRVLTAMEKLAGRSIGEFKNYDLLKDV